MTTVKPQPLPIVDDRKSDAFPQDQLEALIDRYGARTVLAEFADIAYGKAEHLRSNWQDKPAANIWAKLGRKLGVLVDWTNEAVL